MRSCEPPKTAPVSATSEATTGPSLEIWVSIAQASAQIQVDEPSYTSLGNESWKLCRLSKQIKSTPGIYIAGKCGTFYEVAVHPSIIPWLRFLDPELDLEYDPTKPVDGEVRIHGTWKATKRVEARFLKNAARAIRSGRGRGLESCYRKIVRSHLLGLPLEWTILKQDLKYSNAQVLRKLAQHLVFLGLNLLENYDTPAAIELLGKSQDELLFEALRAYHHNSLSKKFTDNDVEQIISLLRCLLEEAGGRKDFRQHRIFQFKAGVNANIYGSFIGIIGSNPFGKFDPQKILSALASSKCFNDEDIHTLDVVDWSRRMMTSLPIGRPDGYMDLPAYVLNELGTGQVDILRASIAHFYHQHPSLRMRGSNILVLLSYCATLNGEIARVLGDWAASNDGSSLYEVLIEEHQDPQTAHQLVLSLATLLSYRQLLPNLSTDNTQPNGRSSLEDFDALISGATLTNERQVVEDMVFSLARVLGTLGDDFQEVVQFLLTVVNRDPPLLNPLDGFSDRHWVQRVHGLSHDNAFEMARLPQFFTEGLMPGSEIEEDWVMEGYESC